MGNICDDNQQPIEPVDPKRSTSIKPLPLPIKKKSHPVKPICVLLYEKSHEQKIAGTAILISPKIVFTSIHYINGVLPNQLNTIRCSFSFNDLLQNSNIGVKSWEIVESGDSNLGDYILFQLEQAVNKLNPVGIRSYSRTRPKDQSLQMLKVTIFQENITKDSLLGLDMVDFWNEEKNHQATRSFPIFVLQKNERMSLIGLHKVILSEQPSVNEEELVNYDGIFTQKLVYDIQETAKEMTQIKSKTKTNQQSKKNIQLKEQQKKDFEGKFTKKLADDFQETKSENNYERKKYIQLKKQQKKQQKKNPELPHFTGQTNLSYEQAKNWLRGTSSPGPLLSKYELSSLGVRSYEQLVGRLRLILSKEPNNAKAAFMLGSVLFDLKHKQQSRRLFFSVLEMEPQGNEEFQYAVSGSLLHLDMSAEAINTFRKAMLKRPDCADLYQNMKIRHPQRLGQRLMNQYSDLFTSMASSLFGLKRYLGATLKVIDAIGLNQKNLNAYNYFGAVLNKLRKKDEAISWYKLATTANTDFGKIFLPSAQKISMLKQQKKYPSSIDQVEEQLIFDLGKHISFGQIYLNMCESHEAATKFYQGALFGAGKEAFDKQLEI